MHNLLNLARMTQLPKLNHSIQRHHRSTRRIIDNSSTINSISPSLRILILPFRPQFINKGVVQHKRGILRRREEIGHGTSHSPMAAAM